MRYLIATLLACFVFSTYGQRIKVSKVEELPLKYERPFFFEYPDSYYKVFINDKDKGIDDVPWIVFSDRKENITYNKPEKSSGVLKKLGFLDQFYVIDEKDGWIHIVKTRTSRTKVLDRYKKRTEDFGWVPKQNMLLWMSGLVNKRTKIHQKLFLVNRADQISTILKKDNKKRIKIYEGPKSKKVFKEISIHSYYYILKQDFENDRYLIAADYKINQFDAEKQVIGWINKTNASLWKTRIALEPNFSKEAFEERKANERFKFICFNNATAVDNYISGEPFDRSSIVLDKDPAFILDEKILSEKNKRRFDGSIIRYPLISSPDDSFFESGVIGDVQVRTLQDQISEIDGINYSKIMRTINERSQTTKKFNILFLVEATNDMKPYKNNIIEAIRKAETTFIDEKQVKYGAVLYTDAIESGKEIKVLPLTADAQSVEEFITDQSFTKVYDSDPYTNVKYALKQGVLESGLGEGATNIIIALGNNADFSVSRIRRVSLHDDKKKMMVEDEEIVELAAGLDINFIVAQLKREQFEKANDIYPKAYASWISQSASKSFQSYSQIKNYIAIDVPNPKMADDFSTSEVLELKGGVNFANIILPPQGQNLDSNRLSEELSASLKSLKDQVKARWNAMNSMISEGNSLKEVSSGGFEPFFADQLMTLIEESKASAWTPEDIRKLIQEKYKLYTKAFIPYKVNSAKYPIAAFVLLMPQSDLQDFVRQLQTLKIIANRDPSEQREALYETFIEFLQQLLGENSDGKLHRYTIDELRALMQGIEGEGFDFGLKNKYGLKEGTDIGDLLKIKKVSDLEIKQITNGVLGSLEKLETALKQGNNYPFSYTSKNAQNKEVVYFWIPSDYLF